MSTLKAPIIFQNLRLVLRKSGISVNQRQGLFVPQAIAEALYAGDDASLRTARERIANFRMSRGNSVLSPAAASSSLEAAPHHSRRNNRPSEDRISSRNVDSASKHFTESRKFSGILGKSPSLPEAQRAYLTYCDQNLFSCNDCVKLISLVLKGPALGFWDDNIHGHPEITQVSDVFQRIAAQFHSPAH